MSVAGKKFKKQTRQMVLKQNSEKNENSEIKENITISGENITCKRKMKIGKYFVYRAV